MRRALTIGVVVVGFAVLIVFGVLFYAYLNLNSIIADNRERLLTAVSNALGRDVQAGEIKATLGWGVSADVTGVKVADDPAISDQPFVEADNVFAKLNLLPLLSKQIDVSEVVLEKPVIRVIQTADGKLNVSTIGRKREHAHREAPREKREGPAGGTPLEGPPGKPRELPSLFVKNFTVEGGQLVFEQKANGTNLTVNSIDLHLRDFALNQAFEIDLTLAALGTTQNLDVAAKIGPVLQGGGLDVNAIPLSAKVKVGPIDFDSLKSIEMIAKAIPPKLAITGPLAADITADGTVDSIKFNVASDLTANQIAFGDTFTKPANLALKLSADGARTGAKIEVRLTEATLGDMDLKATNIQFGGGTTSARIDTNNFDLGAVGKLVPMLAKYDVSGRAELHTDVALVGGKPTANGTVALTGVGLAIPNQKAPPLSALSGTIKLAGNSADAGPLTFNLGAARATLSSHVSSIQPLKLSYQLTADAVKLGDLVPSRPPDEQVNQLASDGSVAITDAGPDVTAHATSASGSVANVEYQNLALDASVAGKQARVTSLKLNAFSGAIAATAATEFKPNAPFTTNVNVSNIDIQQVLVAQKAKAAGTVRGILTGGANVSGVIGNFDQMKPTFRGNGRASVANGKLVGINVGADALKKIPKIPGVGQIISPEIIARHPELFNDPDTDIQTLSLTFQLQGPRIITHDLNVQTVDYGMLGDGWFDMDKNIDLAATITLARGFTQDLISQQKNIVFVTNNNGEVNIPLQIVGQLPKPKVIPNVGELAQQAGTRAVESRGQQAINKFLGNKGLGKFLGGGDNGGNNNGNGNGNNPPPNPLDQLKKFF
jgi:uncharacterized protein involved in outer membrane biogenesis